MKRASRIGGGFASLFLAFFLALSQPAVATPKPVSWPILEVASQAQCSWFAREATAHIFENEVQWQRLFEGSQTPAFAKTLNWDRQVVVALTLGVRPSSGFRISLAEKQFELSEGVLRLAFHEYGPAAGDMALEVMTQPCVFILTPRGKWRHAVLRNSDSGAELTTNAPDAPASTDNKGAKSPKRR